MTKREDVKRSGRNLISKAMTHVPNVYDACSYVTQKAHKHQLQQSPCQTSNQQHPNTKQEWHPFDL